jgi:hypothetical protein
VTAWLGDALTAWMHGVLLVGFAAAGQEQEKDADRGGDGDDAQGGTGAAEFAGFPCGVGDFEVFGEAGDGDGGEGFVGAG